MTLWESLTEAYNTAIKNIDEATRRTEQISLLASRQSQMIDIAMFHNALSLKNSSKPATLPCNTIPVARNMRFFGRQDVLTETDNLLTNSPAGSGMSALAFYGLGGIGKSQTALEYAWIKQPVLDAILWISAENEITIQHGLSLAATKALNLPSAEPQSHQQNAVLVMDWLKNSGKLMLFD